MSDYIQSDEYENYESPLQEDDFIEVFQPGSGGLRREKRIPINEVGVGGLSLTTGRIAMQEKTTTGISVSGWYKVARHIGIAGWASTATLKIGGFGISRDGIYGCEFGDYNAINPTRFIRLTPYAGPGNFSSFSTIKGFRLAFDDANNGSGTYLEAYISVSATVQVTSFLSQNTSNRSAAQGWELISAVLSDGLCPDGVTSATFIEAGAEYDLSKSGIIGVFNFHKLTNDTLQCTIFWPEIPKKGTGITITYPTSNLLIYDGGGQLVGSTAATISNFEIVGRLIKFNYTSISTFTNLNFGPLITEINGTGCKLTITG